MKTNLKKMDQLISRCYNNMIGADPDRSCWWDAFEVLKNIILKIQQEKPSIVLTVEALEEEIDYQLDIQGWLDDYLDELDMLGEYERLSDSCDALLELLQWPDYSDSDIRFLKSSALASLGLEMEAAEYCRKWLREEPDNPVAAAAGIYAYIKAGSLEEAEALVGQYLPDNMVCTDDNFVIMNAAAAFYEAKGDTAGKQALEQAMEKYDDDLEQAFLSDFDDMDEKWDMEDEDGLPFFDLQTGSAAGSLHDGHSIR